MRELVVLAVFLEILGDLGGELAGRLEDQRARHARAAAALGEDVDHRQDEAGGLAGAGLGDADQCRGPSAPTGWPGAGSGSARYSPLRSTARSNSSERPRSAKVMEGPGFGPAFGAGASGAACAKRPCLSSWGRPGRSVARSDDAAETGSWPTCCRRTRAAIPLPRGGDARLRIARVNLRIAIS